MKHGKDLGLGVPGKKDVNANHELDGWIKE